MDMSKLPKFKDDPIPSVQETADMVSNALVHVRSQPNPTTCEGESSPVDEVKFVNGLIDLYMGEKRARTMRDDVHPQAFSMAFQKGLREAQAKGQQ